MRFLLILLNLIILSSCILEQENDPDLVSIAVIFRHGARTTFAFYPTDPHINQTFYPIGLGGLTNEGKRGAYKFGRNLRQIYGDFLGDDYVENRVYVRSTDTTRTKMSVQLLLAGLFPPSKLQEWNAELKWQPIPVEYKTEIDEDLLHPTKNCPFKQRTLGTLPELPEIQEKYIEPYRDLYDLIGAKTGKKPTNPFDLQDLFFILKTENDVGLKLPNWTHQLYPERLESAASLVYNYHNYNHRVKLINTGYTLKKILDDFRLKINGFNERTVSLYSGHESTVGYMMDALNLFFKNRIPPYGSAVIFELRQDDKRHYIKLRYRNDTEATSLIDLVMPNCEILCPFDKFYQLVQDLLPNENIQDLCKSDTGVDR